MQMRLRHPLCFWQHPYYILRSMLLGSGGDNGDDRDTTAVLSRRKRDHCQHNGTYISSAIFTY